MSTKTSATVVLNGHTVTVTLAQNAEFGVPSAETAAVRTDVTSPDLRASKGGAA